MGVIFFWYDFLCLAIVVGSFCIAIAIIWSEEGGEGCREKTMYESLVVSRVDQGECSGSPQHGGGGDLRFWDLWSSCWRGTHPLCVLGLRLAAFLVLAGFLTWDVIDYGVSIFVYYTEWTFLLVVVYFMIGTVVSAIGCKEYMLWMRGSEEDIPLTNSVVFTATKYRRKSMSQQEIYGRIRFLGYTMQILYQACAGAVVLTDVVFWCIILPFLPNERLHLNLLMGCMHSLNLFFLLVDTSVNNISFPWFRISYFMIWSCLYIAFQWIIHACGYQWWPYPFLELSSRWAPLWYLCLALAHVPCYGIYALIVKIKVLLFSQLFPAAFVTS